jgi:hypothetical protein
MKYPMVLPWLARRAGVSDEVARELWAEAIRYATLKTGWVGTSEYWRVATERLLELLDDERIVSGKPGLSPLLQYEAWMWVLPLIAWRSTALAISRGWARAFSRQRTVAN